MHVFLVQLTGEQFDVATPAVNALLVFDSELDDQGLVLVAEGVKAGGGRVESGILAGLES